MNQDKVEITTHLTKTKALWKFVVRASSIDEAIQIINKEYPELNVTKESVLFYSVHKPSEQLKLFNN